MLYDDGWQKVSIFACQNFTFDDNNSKQKTYKCKKWYVRSSVHNTLIEMVKEMGEN